MKYEIEIHKSEHKWVVITFVITPSPGWIINNASVPVSFQVFDTEQEAVEAKIALESLLI